MGMPSSLKTWFRRHALLLHGYEHLRAVLQRGRFPAGRVPPAPARVIVEPTNGCNLGCAYCGNKDMVRPWTFMPLDLYERLLDEMVELGVPRITLHTVGEPTLHKDIARMIAMATERERVVSISTNGTLLHGDLAREVVRAGPDVLNYSADAGDAETFARTRDGMDLEVLLRSMREVRALRDAEGPFRDTPWGRVRVPSITVTAVHTPVFTREVERRFFETFGPLADDFLFHHPNNHADYVPDEPYKRRGLLPPRWRDRVYKLVRRPCMYPWDSLFLLSDGTMSVCRFDFDARVEIGAYGPQSLLELWNGVRMQSLRRAHMDFDFRDWSMCEDCTATYYENRDIHYHLTRKLMKRNGVVPRRNSWLTANPYGVRPEPAQASTAGTAR